MHRSFYIRVGFTLLYLGIGYWIDVSGETRSLAFMRLPVIEEHWLPLYPLYLICRTQAFIFYTAWWMMVYPVGLFVLLSLWHVMLVMVVLTVPKNIALQVMREYLRPTNS